jgi:hypothetical protein
MVSETQFRPFFVNTDKPIIRLLLDNATVIHVGDKPIFGVDVTISESLKSVAGKIILPGVILGWVNYIDVSKFACITPDNHYVEATNFIYTAHNQIIVSKAIKVHEFDENMSKTKHILSFSEVA